jgi:outer membrane protein assembly factor BamE
MTARRLLLAIPAALLLTACSVDRIPGVYRIDVQQGNVVTHDMLAQIQPGMSRQQVRFVMGTPMIVDTFHPDRWDYYFSLQPGRGERQSHHVTLIFDGDLLQRVDGELPPAATDAAATSGARTVAVTGPVPDSRGLLDRAWDALTDWEFSGSDETTPEATEQTAGPAEPASEAN